MHKNGIALLALLALMGCGSRPPDAARVLDDVSAALGVTDLRSVQYSATGYVSNGGSSYLPDGPGPKFNAKLTRKADFERGVAEDEVIRTAHEDPPRGAGGQPLYRESRALGVRRPDDPFGADGLVMTTPQGWVRAARAAMPTATTGTLDGRPVTIISFMMADKYTVTGYVNAESLLEKVATTVLEEVTGDIPVETTFSDYRRFGTVLFPSRIAQTRDGLHAFDYTVTDVQANAAGTIDVPARASREEVVEPKPFGPGIWYLSGGAVNSTLVEFDTFVAVVETGANLDRARATIAQVKRMTSKPIMHVNSHHHVDHWSGLRDWIFADATIITHEMNRELYDQVLKNPYTLGPDDLARNPKPAKFEFVKDKHVLTDGKRTMEIHWIEGNLHSANLLMSYLPNEKLLIVTDIFNMFYQPRPNDPPDGFASPYTMNLWDNIQRLKLDIRFIAPGHGREVVPVEELRQKVVGKKVLSPSVQ